MTSHPIAVPLASIKLPLPVAELSGIIDDLTTKHGDGIVLRQYGSHIVAFTEGEVCGCGECREVIDSVIDSFYSILSQGMILCPLCGNKRCPHASSHRYACTQSNVFGHTPELLPEYEAEK